MASGTPARAGAPRPAARRLWLIAAGLVVLYLVTHALLLSRFPWFVDEALFSTYAQTTEGDRTQRFAALVDHKGLLNTWFAALGIHAGMSPMVALRLVSVVSGLVAAGATAALVRAWRGPVEALVAGGLVLFVPFFFVHDAVAVYDAFIAAGSMVALALQLWLARTQRLDAALLLGITWGMLLLSKPTGALAIGLVPFSLLLFDWRPEARLRRLAAWAGLVIVALVIAAAMYALVFLSPLIYQAGPDNHRGLGDLASDPFGALGVVAGPAFEALLGYMTLPVLLAGLWGMWLAVRTRDRVGLVLAIWALAALATFLLLTDVAYPRYGLQIAAPLCALAVFGAADLWRILERRWSRRIASGVAALALVPLVVLDTRVVLTPETAPYPGLDYRQFVTLLSNRQPLREASELILERSGEVTAATPPQDRTVAVITRWYETANLVLNGRHRSVAPRFTLVPSGQPVDVINAARFVIVETQAEPEGNQPGLIVRPEQIVRSWTRPDGGPTTTLYDRGAAGAPAADPAESSP